MPRQSRARRGRDRDRGQHGLGEPAHSPVRSPVERDLLRRLAAETGLAPASVPGESDGATSRLHPDSAGRCVLPARAGGRVWGAVCLSDFPAPPDPALERDALLHRILGLIGRRAELQHERRNSQAAGNRYERWFRTLDEQVRVLERERQKFSAVVHQSEALAFVTDPQRRIRWTNNALALQGAPSTGGGWIGLTCGPWLRIESRRRRADADRARSAGRSKPISARPRNTSGLRARGP